MNRKNLTIQDTLKLSTKQHEFYKTKWKPLVKENAPEKALWLVGEFGEVIDIIKKKGANEIMENKEVRAEFVKELSDCYMYLADILNCYNISGEELSITYSNKVDFNLKNPRKYWIKKK